MKKNKKLCMIMLVFFVLPGCKQKEVSNVQEKNKLVISVKDMTPPAIKIKEPVRIKIGTSDFDIRIILQLRITMAWNLHVLLKVPYQQRKQGNMI
ncbi:MAG: hypothetical protein ACLUJS_14550 [Anaerostipes hadrus]